MTYEVSEPFAWNFCPACGLRLVPADDGESDRPYCSVCRRFYYSNPTPATCCFVRGDAGSLLLVKRGIEPCKGQWSLPGGFLELGESPEEGAFRELLEETGLQANALRLLGASTRPSIHSGAVLVLAYLVEVWRGELLPGSDVQAARFFSLEERPPLAFSVHRELLALYDALPS